MIEPWRRSRDDHKLFRVRIGQRLQEHAVHDTENGGVCPDAKGQSQHGDGGKSGILEEHAGRKPEILQQRFKKRKPAAVAVVFFGLLHAAELDQRLTPRLFCAHPRAEIIFNVHLQMAFHLRGEFAVAAFPMEQSAKSRKPSSQPPHNHTFPCITKAAGLKTGHYKIIRSAGRPWGRRGSLGARGGSMLPARRTKGTQLPAANVSGSLAWTPNSNPDSVRDNASATTNPIPTPRRARLPPSRRIVCKMFVRCAPRAMRIPISRVRSPTE